jgi:MFS transporter, SP family, sugar:H+ symporter
VALKRLRKYQVSEVEIQRQLDKLAEATAVEQQTSNFADIFTLLNRKRTWVVILVNVFQQATGQAFASQFGALFVKSLKTLQPFSITMGTNAIDIGALLICLVTSDVLGRRSVCLNSLSLKSC